MHDVGDVSDGQKRNLRTVKGTPARSRTGLGPGAPGFFFLIMPASGFIKEFCDVLWLHV